MTESDVRRIVREELDANRDATNRQFANFLDTLVKRSRQSPVEPTDSEALLYRVASGLDGPVAVIANPPRALVEAMRQLNDERRDGDGAAPELSPRPKTPTDSVALPPSEPLPAAEY